MTTTATTTTRVAAPPVAPPATLWRCGGRTCGAGECRHEEGELHRHAAGDGPAYAPPIVHEVLGSTGTPLPAGLRQEMEGRLGHSFADVRIHTDDRAARSAAAVGAHAYTVGRQIVFGAGRFDAVGSSGQRLLAHELTHAAGSVDGTRSVGPLRVSSPDEPAERHAEHVAGHQGHQDRRAQASGRAAPHPGGVLHRVRCSLVPAGVCAAPIAGSAEDFGVAETAREVGPRARRAGMTPARQVSTGHTGRARQLELILEAASPGLLANVHGIFLDRDMSPGTGAVTQTCASMVPPVPAPAGATCVFVPPELNVQGRRFREGAATVGGQPRADWHISTLQTLTHEIQHARFDSAGLGQPAGVGAATCPRSAVEFELSELSAMMSEFPTVFRAIPVGAPAGDPSRTRLAAWFNATITNPGESIRGALTGMRCRCDCPEVDAFVRQTFTFTASSWTAAERTAFNTELRRPVWALSWPVAP